MRVLVVHHVQVILICLHISQQIIRRDIAALCLLVVCAPREREISSSQHCIHLSVSCPSMPGCARATQLRSPPQSHSWCPQPPLSLSPEVMGENCPSAAPWGSVSFTLGLQHIQPPQFTGKMPQFIPYLRLSREELWDWGCAHPGTLPSLLIRVEEESMRMFSVRLSPLLRSSLDSLPSPAGISFRLKLGKKGKLNNQRSIKFPFQPANSLGTGVQLQFEW